MEQQNSMQPQMNMQGQENGQHVPGYGTQSNMPPYVAQQMQFGETQQQKERRAEIFSIMAMPTCIYAGLYTVLLYNNYQSIALPLFVVITIGYCMYLKTHLYKMNQKEFYVKPMSLFCMIGMLGLAICTASTGNEWIWMLNEAGIVCLLICMLLFEFCNTKKWTLAKGVGSIFVAIGGAISYIGEPFSDLSCFRKFKKKKETGKAGYIVVGVLISIPVLAIVIALLYQADAVFANLFGNLFSIDFHFGTWVGMVFMFGYALLAAYCGIRFLASEKISAESKDMRHFEPMIANTILVLISIVYAAFSFIQIFSLFLGKMRLPDGYTYARYAREGFFQLLFVCMINVGLVLLFMGLFRENHFKKILLTVICGCTYIMIASSAFRMCLYIQHYNLTFLRLFVLWMLAVIGILLTGILVQIYVNKFALFRYTIVVVTVCVFALGVAHPDYWIAKYDVVHLNSTATENGIDHNYLQTLSTDAAPVIATQNGEWAEEYGKYVVQTLEKEKEGLREYNFSHAKAKALFTEQKTR